MKFSFIEGSAGALVTALFLAQAAQAQDPAPGLQDLVGVRGSSGERVLQERGYTFIRTSKSGNDSYMYWREARTGHCISVHVADGRYQSLVKTSNLDCKGGTSADSTATKEFDEHGSRFATVCGVTVDNKPYRYQCTVEGAVPGGSGKTVLHYPDQKITLHWHGGNRVSVMFEGMKVQETTFNTSEGNTQFFYEGKTYFYTSDPGAAEMEVKHFRDQ